MRNVSMWPCHVCRYADLKIVQKEPGASEDEGFVAFTYKWVWKSGGGEEYAWECTEGRAMCMGGHVQRKGRGRKEG